MKPITRPDVIVSIRHNSALDVKDSRVNEAGLLIYVAGLVIGPKVTSIVDPAAIIDDMLPVIVIVLKLVLGVQVMVYTKIPNTLTEQSGNELGTVTILG